MREENHSSNFHSPLKTLIFLLSIGVLCYITALVFPASVSISNDLQLVYFSPDVFFPNTDSTETEPVIEDIEEFLESYTVEIDSTAILDSIQKAEALRRQELLKIQFPEEGAYALENFYSALRELESEPSLHVRALHYGDSQIEGDRITGFLRSRFQEEFGGYGPGLLPALEVVPTGAIDQENSENWSRYTIFGRPDTLVTHNRYGVLANFGMFTSPTYDSTKTSIDSAWIALKPSRITYSRSKKFDKLRLWMGDISEGTELSITSNDSVLWKQELEASAYFSKTWDLRKTPKELNINISAVHSPEFYTYSLESSSGIHIDNIGMRGSSGTIFRKMDSGLLSKQLNELDVELLILQFGGNSVPYIESKEKADSYGKWFGSQIRLLKQLRPDVSILVIGPSDMATKVKSEFVTYPYLLDVRNALKKAAFDHGCAFWDLYEVMGGKNSMEVWVNADPPLAGSDYVHFTPKGAKKVAELLHKALTDEYSNWKKNEKSE